MLVLTQSSKSAGLYIKITPTGGFVLRAPVLPRVHKEGIRTYLRDPRGGGLGGPLDALARAREGRGGHADRLAMRQHFEL